MIPASLNIIEMNRCQLRKKCIFLIQDQTLLTRQNDYSLSLKHSPGGFFHIRYTVWFICWAYYAKLRKLLRFLRVQNPLVLTLLFKVSSRGFRQQQKQTFTNRIRQSAYDNCFRTSVRFAGNPVVKISFSQKRFFTIVIKEFHNNLNFCVDDWNFWIFRSQFRKSLRIRETGICKNKNQHFIKSLHRSKRPLILVSYLI